MAAEAAHFSKTKGAQEEAPTEPVPRLKRDLEEDVEANLDEEDAEAKRRRILEETRDIDADSVGSDSDSSDEDRFVVPCCVVSRLVVALELTSERSDDEEDEAAELMRELEKIKRERQEQKEKEVGFMLPFAGSMQI